MSRNIRSLCNTTHSNERFVPITGYRRHTDIIAQGPNTLIIRLATTDFPLRMMGMMDDKASRGCPSYSLVGEKKNGAEHHQ